MVATNAYGRSLAALRRQLFTVCAYVTLTAPLTAAQWARVRWERRMGVEDRRLMPHFHRPRPDGRILWGGRNAPLLAGPPGPARDPDPAVFVRLEESFRRTFPQLRDGAIEGRAGGGDPFLHPPRRLVGAGAAAVRRRLLRPRRQPLRADGQGGARPAAGPAHPAHRAASGHAPAHPAPPGPLQTPSSGPRAGCCRASPLAPTVPTRRRASRSGWGRDLGGPAHRALSVAPALRGRVVLGLAAATQQRSARAQPRRAPLSPRLILGRLRGRWWVSAVGLMVAGYCAPAAALGEGRLAVVEPLLTP